MHAPWYSRLHHALMIDFKDQIIARAGIVSGIALSFASFASGVVVPETFDSVGLG